MQAVFDGRQEKLACIAPYAFLFNRIYNRRGGDFGVEAFSHAEFTCLLLDLLLFLYEGTMAKDYPDLKGIEDFLEDRLKAVYHKDVGEKLSDFAYYLTVGLLLNGGDAPFQFEVTGGDDVQIRLAEMVAIQGPDGLPTYRLTAQGCEFIVRIKDIEKYLHEEMTMRLIFLKEELSRRNFDGALSEVRKMARIIRMYDMQLDDLFLRIRRDAGKVSFEEYADLLSRTLHDLSSQQAQFKDIRKAYGGLLTEMNEAGLADKKELKRVRNLKGEMERTYTEHGKLFLKRNQAYKVWEEALENYQSMGMAPRLSVERDVLAFVMTGKAKKDGLENFLMPVLPLSIPQGFNPFSAFLAQAPVKKTVDTGGILSDEETEPDQREERYQTLAYNYSVFVETLISGALENGGEVTFSGLMAKLEKQHHDRFMSLSADPVFFKTVLDLFLMKPIDLDGCRKRYEDLTMQPDGRFNLDLAVGMATERVETLRKAKQLSVVREQQPGPGFAKEGLGIEECLIKVVA